MREIITLQCPECKNRNYSTTKNKKTTTGRLEFRSSATVPQAHRLTRRRSKSSSSDVGMSKSARGTQLMAER